MFNSPLPCPLCPSEEAPDYPGAPFLCGKCPSYRQIQRQRTLHRSAVHPHQPYLQEKGDGTLFLPRQYQGSARRRHTATGKERCRIGRMILKTYRLRPPNKASSHRKSNRSTNNPFNHQEKQAIYYYGAETLCFYSIIIATIEAT